MKLSNNKKIILLISGLGILTTSIVIPIVVLNNNAKQNSEDLDKVNEIIAKIKDKDILIAPNVSTQNQNEIQNAIKDQLKKENQTLNENDLSKITTNIKSLTLGEKIEINLIIKIRNITKELTINLKKINLLKNSNITNGYGGTIFQDSFKNLWTMASEKKLQVLKVNSSGNGYENPWVNDNKNTGDKLLKNSNITNGFGGKIFQDKFKNLWTMGYKTQLQVLKVNVSKDGYVSEGWTDVTTQGLLNGSNIIDGKGGIIFQDSFGNLWTMSEGKKLQVLKVNSNGDGYVESWTNNNTQGLLKGSNIIDGKQGTIFQDSFGNLWTIVYENKLQVLKVNDSKNGYVESWTDDNTQGLLKGSNITDGGEGTIFQDKFKNLWAMGFQKKLQVLKVNSNGDGYVSKGWTDDIAQELLNGSNITNGWRGTIFQDFFGNLWTIVYENKLQVLKVNSVGTGYVKSWTDNTNLGLTNGSNIYLGEYGTIFQDSFKNLWAMSTKTPLQILKANSNGDGYVSKGWTDDITEGLLKGSNITNGSFGTIFQDSFGNLWAIGSQVKLQVLIANSDNTGYINSWLY